MTELTLTLWFLVGAPISQPTTLQECADLLGWARYAEATGGVMTRDGKGVIAVIECGGSRYEFRLPGAGDHCEVPAS